VLPDSEVTHAASAVEVHAVQPVPVSENPALHEYATDSAVPDPLPLASKRCSCPNVLLLLAISHPLLLDGVLIQFWMSTAIPLPPELENVALPPIEAGEDALALNPPTVPPADVQNVAH